MIHQLHTTITNSASLEDLAVVYASIFGKQGRLAEQFTQLKTITDIDAKKAHGKMVSDAKDALQTTYDTQYAMLQKKAIDLTLANDPVDIHIQSQDIHRGTYSLLTATRRKIEDICQNMGFAVSYGHDMVTKFENFTSLNIPLTHPATEMHDTFFVDRRDETGENYVLRTHTTAMDNALIKLHGVPCKQAVISKVYRYESTDASHDTTFYQAEGICIDKGISVAHFKSFIQTFLSAVFEKEVTIRMRPGYFPFVEPGFEIDASCPMCAQQGCGLCKKTGWIEMMGAGMLHPEVLTQAGVDPTIYSGYAFGIGINRLVAIKYKIKDIRYFTNGDLTFSRSFR